MRMLAVWDVVMKTVCSGVSVSSGWCVLYGNGRWWASRTVKRMVGAGRRAARCDAAAGSAGTRGYATRPRSWATWATWAASVAADGGGGDCCCCSCCFCCCCRRTCVGCVLVVAGVWSTWRLLSICEVSTTDIYTRGSRFFLVFVVCLSDLGGGGLGISGRSTW